MYSQIRSHVQGLKLGNIILEPLFNSLKQHTGKKSDFIIASKLSGWAHKTEYLYLNAYAQ